MATTAVVPPTTHSTRAIHPSLVLSRCAPPAPRRVLDWAWSVVLAHRGEPLDLSPIVELDLIASHPHPILVPPGVVFYVAELCGVGLPSWDRLHAQARRERWAMDFSLPHEAGTSVGLDLTRALALILAKEATNE